jgi:hypothetical protein
LLNVVYAPVMVKPETVAGHAGIEVSKTNLAPVFGGVLNEPATTDPGGPLNVMTAPGPAVTVPVPSVYWVTLGAIAGDPIQFVSTLILTESDVTKFEQLLANPVLSLYLPAPMMSVKPLIVPPDGVLRLLAQSLLALTVNLILTLVTVEVPVGVSAGEKDPLPAENLQLPVPTASGTADATAGATTVASETRSQCC